jgi:hypothetical protein
MIIGYFQSYKFLQGETEELFLSMLTPSNPGPEWYRWSQRALIERPVIVHIRLGDYLLEKKFGIVTTGYILEALTSMGLHLDNRQIWVFSDQIKLASSIVPPKLSDRIVWVSEIDSDPLATMSIMRLGTGYVIANSSFSWWAARSKQILESPVYCPRPWFSGAETPRDLLPTHWIQVDSSPKEQK